MIWTQPDAISAFPCCTGSDMFTWVSGILEDMSALRPCANTPGRLSTPITALHHQKPLGKGQTELPQPQSIVPMASPPSESREAPCTEHTLPQEQTNFNIYRAVLGRIWKND